MVRQTRALVAQLDRAFGYGPKGWEFEPSLVHELQIQYLQLFSCNYICHGIYSYHSFTACSWRYVSQSHRRRLPVSGPYPFTSKDLFILWQSFHICQSMIRKYPICLVCQPPACGRLSALYILCSRSIPKPLPCGIYGRGSVVSLYRGHMSRRPSGAAVP